MNLVRIVKKVKIGTLTIVEEIQADHSRVKLSRMTKKRIRMEITKMRVESQKKNFKKMMTMISFLMKKTSLLQTTIRATLDK